MNNLRHSALQLQKGDVVTHNFSKWVGVVIDIRNDSQNYDYRVAFNGGTHIRRDWFKREVLVLRPSTQKKEEE